MRGGSGVREKFRAPWDALVDDRYRIVANLGKGGSGVVFRAEDVVLERCVALKLVAESTGSGILEEARALAQVRHENVAQLYAFGRHDTWLYIAMEDVAGRDLDAMLLELAASGRRLDAERAFEIVRDVGRGLDAVHARGLVHRDVKPGNIVIENGTGRPVLVDFGMALRLDRTDEASPGGTPAYMAPEQAADATGTAATARSDLYALAATAFELFTGDVVFPRRQAFEALVAHQKEPPPPISTRRPDLYPLDDVFFRALAKDPAARHESCEAFTRELQAALRKARAIAGRREAPAFRVLVLMRDGDARAQVEGVVDRALARFQTDVACVDSTVALLEAHAASPADLVLIDDEATGAQAPFLVEALRAAPHAEATEALAFVSAPNRRSQRLAILGVPEIPKPIVMHVLGVAVTRLAAQATQRRARLTG
jgi:serine/threonine-protein kinase